jgi:hypothetical protein
MMGSALLTSTIRQIRGALTVGSGHPAAVKGGLPMVVATDLYSLA